MEEIHGTNPSQFSAAKEERGACGSAICGQFSTSGVGEWAECEEPKPKPKEKWDRMKGRQRLTSIAQGGVRPPKSIVA